MCINIYKVVMVVNILERMAEVQSMKMVGRMARAMIKMPIYPSRITV